MFDSGIVKVYVSRYGNLELRKGTYTAVRISLGSPKWDIGYRINGEFKNLMPFGLLGKYEDYEPFKREYFLRLDRVGVSRIRAELETWKRLGRDVVLLCFEDIRKGPENWCHRTAFAEWWTLRTGEEIEELPDPSRFVLLDPKSLSKPVKQEEPIIPQAVQLSLF